MPKSSLSSVISTKKLYAGGDPLIGVLRGLPDAVLMIGADGDIFYANPAAEKLFGFAPNSKESIALADILPESSPYRAAEHLAALWRRVEITGRIENFETQMLDKDGKSSRSIR
ncbi:MAG: PAS domain-containing protein [Pyrinomonadaceae bacterium]|nr:PAS domain-containing protein [Pyrinomonadaceae bacterium]